VAIAIVGPGEAPVAGAGCTVVIDVFRAFSTAYHIAAARPERYVAVDDIDLAFSLRAELAPALVVGERGGLKIAGADFGNSPVELGGRDFRGMTVIHTTTAGTKGLLRQCGGGEVVVGSFVNRAALVRRLHRRRPEKVVLYCTAPRGDAYGREDYVFAAFLRDCLLGLPVDFAAVKENLRAGSLMAFGPGGFAPPGDFDACLDLDRFDSVLARGRPVAGGRGCELAEAAD
jgi:2-phosphosulfolactate phosphatase